MKSSIRIALCGMVGLLSLESGAASAQSAPSPRNGNVLQAKRVKGTAEVRRPIQVNGVTVQPMSGSTAKAGHRTIYDNTYENGWYSTSTPAIGSIWHDWGIVTAADQSAASTHRTITELSLGYQSGRGNGTTSGLDFFLFTGSTGWCSNNGLGDLELAVRVTGLPGSSYWCWPPVGWTFTVPLENLDGTGPSLCFELPQGPIGYGYDFHDNHNDGVITVGRPNPSGVQDAFDFYDATGVTCTGTYWFGGYGATNPMASFYLGLRGKQSWETFPRSSDPPACLTSCGGEWSLSAEGCACAGDPITITASCSVPYTNPAEQTAALAVSCSPPTPTHVFATGCSLDVPAPFAIFIIGDGESPIVMSATFPALPASVSQVTMMLLVSDRGDSGCVTGGWGVVTSDVLVANVH